MACAWALANEGVHVTLVARRAEALQIAAERIAEATGKQPGFVVADVGTAQGRCGPGVEYRARHPALSRIFLTGRLGL
jgi:NAD(P)-dependent dehydrogenase (short-subunit alcohol dehydrogenase family)